MSKVNIQQDPHPQTHMYLRQNLWRGGNTPSYPYHSSSMSHASKLFLASRLKGSCKAGLEKDGKLSENVILILNYQFLNCVQLSFY